MSSPDQIRLYDDQFDGPGYSPFPRHEAARVDYCDLFFTDLMQKC